MRMNVQWVFGSCHTKRKHRRSEDSRDIPSSQEEIRDRKRGRLTQIATKKTTIVHLVGTTSSKENQGGKQWTGYDQKSQDTLQLRKSGSSQARSGQFGRTNIIFGIEEI
ncbi:hypothetical protein TNCV_1199451 [Trichonephila clavipes]|uniref:Uncharacterized protein n=1 Tax=Trichonephila clavipes TaxID=2585209 RepID=A0A8X6S795_TRICX|nr:hypothetical protein TNCV_1199451 [Trichonephila clavipes]